VLSVPVFCAYIIRLQAGDPSLNINHLMLGSTWMKMGSSIGELPTIGVPAAKARFLTTNSRGRNDQESRLSHMFDRRHNNGPST
jgi:hypothetical protein